jgi:hypothetical protein
MSKNLHDMDEIFKSAYERFGDDPSPDVWEKINAGLDKKDAAAYKRTSRNWKRAAIFLLFILSGFIIYEAGIVKTPVSQSKKAAPIAAGKIRPDKNIPKQDETTNLNHSLPGKSGNKESTIRIEDNILGNTRINVNGNRNIVTSFPHNSKKYMPGLLNEKVKVGVDNTRQQEVTGTSLSVPPVSEKELLKSNQFSVKERIRTPSAEKSHDELVNSQLSYRDLSHVLNDGPSTSGTSKTNTQKSGVHFRPYWTVTAFTSYDWVNYRLDNDFQTVKKIKDQETHEPSVSTGALLTRQLTNRWALLAGLFYSKTSIGIGQQKIYAFNVPAGSVSYKYVASSGYGYVNPKFSTTPAVGDSLIAAEANHTLEQICLPLMIKYRIQKNKLSFLPGLGITANFLTSEKIKTEVKDASHREIVSINKLNGTRPNNLSLIADAEIQYKLAAKMSLNFRPALRYAISPITKGNVVETYPYSFEAGLGLTYRF